MKKQLILLLALFSFSCLQADIGETISNGIDSAKVAVSETVTTIDTSSNFKLMYNDIKSTLATLATSLKVGAEHVYGVLIKQQIAISITNIFIYLLQIIILIIFIKIGLKLYNNHKKEHPHNDLIESTVGFTSITIFILTSILSIIFMVFILDSFSETITGFVNPEYGAIKEIIELAKSYK